MKKYLHSSFHFFTLFTVLIVSSCNVQNSCKIEDYYLNDDIFKIDSTYLKVSIDGKSFKVKVLSDKLNEYLEEFELSEYDFNFLSPKTVVFYMMRLGTLYLSKNLILQNITSSNKVEIYLKKASCT